MKKALFILMLSLFSLPGWSQTEKQKADSAENLMREGDFVGAIGLYDELIKANPKDDTYFLNRGWSKLNASGFRYGADDLQKSLAINPGCARCYIGMAISSFQLLKLDEALNYANQAVKLSDTASFNYFIRGQIKESALDFVGAGQDFDKAIQLNSTSADYFYSRGAYHFRGNRYAMAIKDFTMAIHLDPTEADFFFQRGYAHYMLQNLDDAAIDVKQAIRLDSLNADYWLGRGAIEDAAGYVEAAIKSYGRVMELDPNNAMAYYNRANLLYVNDRLDESCADFNKARTLIRTAPGNGDGMRIEIEGMIQNHCDTTWASFYYQRGLSCINAGLYDKAIKWLDLGMERFPQHPLIYSFKGNALMASHRYEEAEQAYSLALKYTEEIPSDVKYSYILAFKESDPADYMRSIYASTYDGRAKARFAQGRYEAALEDADRAIQLMTKLPGINDAMYQVSKASILGALSRHSEARNILDKVVTENPGLMEACVIRARILMEMALIASGKKIKIDYKVSLASGLVYVAKPKKYKMGKIDEDLYNLAMLDIQTVLGKKANIGETYFILAQLKYFKGQKDYCADLLMAQTLGISDALTVLDPACAREEIK